MSTREELEKQLEIARKRLDDAPRETPKDVLGEYREEYDRISFELDNLYDEPSTRSI